MSIPAVRPVDSDPARASPKPLVEVGEAFGKTVRFSVEDIAAFALACHDANPLHRDAEEAAQSGFGDIIASGSHTGSMLMGLAASHLSRRGDGVARQMLGLNFNLAFKAPIYAGEDIHLQWRVSSVEWNARLGGCIAHLDGHASTLRSGVAVVARATVLVKETT